MLTYFTYWSEDSLLILLRAEVFMERDDYIQIWVGLEIRGFMEEVEFELEYKLVIFCLKSQESPSRPREN